MFSYSNWDAFASGAVFEPEVMESFLLELGALKWVRLLQTEEYLRCVWIKLVD